MNLGASPQLECWNNGTMEQWVLEKWGHGILAIFLLNWILDEYNSGENI